MEKILLKYYKEDKIHFGAKYIYVEGECPVALVAHLDTVYQKTPQQVFHDASKKVIWSPEGIGGDDRAGVYSIIKILQNGYRPSILLCCDEECGALGADNLVEDFPVPLASIKFIIELDRRGKQDAVYYDCDNTDFEDFITNHGFKTAFGSFSDISIIAPAWHIAAVNLSVGYYNEHSASEYWCYHDTHITIKKVCKILEDAETLDKSFEYIPLLSRWHSGMDAPHGTCGYCGYPLSEQESKKKAVYGYKLCDICREYVWGGND